MPHPPFIHTTGTSSSCSSFLGNSYSSSFITAPKKRVHWLEPFVFLNDPIVVGFWRISLELQEAEIRTYSVLNGDVDVCVRLVRVTNMQENLLVLIWPPAIGHLLPQRVDLFPWT